MLLGELVGGEHEAVCDDSPNSAWDKPSPKARIPFLLVYRYGAVDDAAVGHYAFELGELGLSGDL